MAAPTINLLDARAFPRIAPAAGITESARALVLAGRLTPVVVGRVTFYRWMDLIPLMPAWARGRHAALAMPPVTTTEHRSGLAGHTVTVERATRLVALRVGVHAGDLVVVERTDGRLGVPVAVPGGEVPVVFAEAYASSRGARYVDIRQLVGEQGGGS